MGLQRSARRPRTAFSARAHHGDGVRVCEGGERVVGAGGDDRGARRAGDDGAARAWQRRRSLSTLSQSQSQSQSQSPSSFRAEMRIL
eukprot:112029-Rhodomonas_salina.1